MHIHTLHSRSDKIAHGKMQENGNDDLNVILATRATHRRCVNVHMGIITKAIIEYVITVSHYTKWWRDIATRTANSDHHDRHRLLCFSNPKSEASQVLTKCTEQMMDNGDNVCTLATIRADAKSCSFRVSELRTMPMCLCNCNCVYTLLSHMIS